MIKSFKNLGILVSIFFVSACGQQNMSDTSSNSYVVTEDTQTLVDNSATRCALGLAQGALTGVRDVAVGLGSLVSGLGKTVCYVVETDYQIARHLLGYKDATLALAKKGENQAQLVERIRVIMTTLVPMMRDYLNETVPWYNQLPPSHQSQWLCKIIARISFDVALTVAGPAKVASAVKNVGGKVATPAKGALSKLMRNGEFPANSKQQIISAIAENKPDFHTIAQNTPKTKTSPKCSTGLAKPKMPAFVTTEIEALRSIAARQKAYNLLKEKGQGWKVKLPDGTMADPKNVRLTQAQESAIAGSDGARYKRILSQKGLHSELSAGELEAIAMYTASSGWYKTLNTSMRAVASSEGFSVFTRLGNYQDTLAVGILSALNKIKNYAGTTYRYVQMNETLLASMKAGEVYVESAFMSTAKVAKAPDGIAFDACIKVVGKSGKDISKANIQFLELGVDEAEILFRPGSRFKVVKVANEAIPGYPNKTGRVITLSEL